MWPNCGLAVTSVFKVRKAVWEKKTKLETEWGRKTDECEWGGGVGGGSILMLVVTT